MLFEVDVFISYAHIDNVPLKEGEQGWIANFHKALEVRLSQLLGEKARIWRDQKLQGNDFFGDEIVEQFPKTAVMISILSPRYLKSEWCTKEVREFHQKAAEGKGVKIGNKSRIFKVIKTAVPYDAHPKEIADTLGYEFYVRDSLSSRVKELDQKSSGDLEQLYWGKLDDIANDICVLLETLQQTGSTAVINHSEEQLTVFLADSCSDLKEQNDMIKRELIRAGYRVVPDCRLPFVVSEFNRVVEDFLDQSVLSIHLVGGSGGMVPEGSLESIVALQNELAAKKSKTGNLSRLVWLLPGAPGNDERHNRFVQRLRTDDESQAGADLFETSIEDFKSAILQKLEQIKSAKSGKNASVYLAETNFNLQTYREKLKQELIGMGYHVLPEQSLPLVHEEFIKTVDNLLEQCGISIHILGEDYGVVPDKTDKSVVYLQYERSAERIRKGSLKRLVRLPLTCNETDERMLVFLEKVKTEMKENTDPNDYIIETSLDDMGSLILKKLRKIEEEKRKNKEKEKAPGTAEPSGKGPSLVYLICDRMDVDHITELEDLLFESGCEVIIPVFDGNEEELIADHRENLKSCDAALIYYGEGNELWIRSITRDLTKIDGYGRTHPLNLRGVFLAPPAGKPKERFRLHDTLIIDGMQGFSPGLMQPFLEKLKSLGAM
ncbi:MAG: hypothetical protein QG657_4892 [Acidobacteriota bacterium]|nr:hypothetical protein [Acidobacteriota bacterium]